MQEKVAGALVPSLWAAASLVATTALIAEIAAEPTADPSIHSSTWTPLTAVAALFLGSGSLHGSFEPGAIVFGLAATVLVCVAAGALAVAFIAYCLGPHPLAAAAAILGAACGLAAEILLINLLCNWLQADNSIYTALPTWAWWVAWGAWGITLGLTLSIAGRSRQRSTVEERGGGLAGHSPSAEAAPALPHVTPLEP